MSASRINIKNRKASFQYELLDTFEAGIKLSGSEIKSIRAGGASINEAFCAFRKDELFIRNMNIDPYENEGHYGQEPRRDRKLLLNRHELEKLQKKLKDQGMTIIPTRLYIGKSGYAKVEIALARGKKTHDKRQSLKEKDMKRELGRHG